MRMFGAKIILHLVSLILSDSLTEFCLVSLFIIKFFGKILKTILVYVVGLFLDAGSDSLG